MRSTRRISRWITAPLLLGLSTGLLLSSAATAAPSRATTATPDISGTWTRYPTPNPAAQSSDANNAPPLKPPYAAAYKASREAPAAAHTKSTLPPTPAPAPARAKCTYEGMPTIMAARAPLEILQTPGQVTVLSEYMTQTRRIYLDSPLPPPDDINPGYMGYSVATWHGATLEVQTIGIRDDVRYQQIPHSANMKILEKIRLTAPDLLRDELTILDPDTLTGPYHLTFTYKRDPNYRIKEFVCPTAP